MVVWSRRHTLGMLARAFTLILNFAAILLVFVRQVGSTGASQIQLCTDSLIPAADGRYRPFSAFLDGGVRLPTAFAWN